MMSQKIIEHLDLGRPGHDWQSFWCGMMENHVKYIPAPDSWTEMITDGEVGSPDRCCRRCQVYTNCTAWSYEGVAGDDTSNCTLMELRVSNFLQKDQDENFVSGLSATAAIANAATFYGVDTSQFGMPIQVRKLS